MSFIDFASRMYPYWLLGAFMAWAVWKSDYKDLISFDKKTFIKFFLFMLLVCVYRYAIARIAIYYGLRSNFEIANKLPIGAVFFTPWEDLCHSLPLVLLRKIIGLNKWTYPIHFLAIILITASFSAGHLYQGIFSAALLGLYIPFAVNFGQKKGFGTLMVNHILYDFLTIMVIRIALLS